MKKLNFDGDYRDNVNRLSTVGLDPIYTIGDDRCFDVVNRSGHANYHIDMTKLYDYYDVEYNEDGNRAFVEDSNYTVPVMSQTLSKVVQIQPQPTTTLTLIQMMVHVYLTTV